MDVVVPFAGSAGELRALDERLAALALTEDDTLVIVDNNPRPLAAVGLRHPVLPAAARLTPAYARNRGAQAGNGEWLLFLDADVTPLPGLLGALFEPAPGPEVALLAGTVSDAPEPRGGAPAARYAYLTRLLSHERTLGMGAWGFPNTANLACRRTAFEQIGGFREDIRAGEDGDLTFRLRGGGWHMERREAATAVHRSRQTLRRLVTQKACHGAGAAWLDRHYPGSLPPRRLPGMFWWGLRFALRGLYEGVRDRDRDRVLCGLLDPLEQLSYELGRSLPNERPLPPRSPWRLLL